MPCPRARYAMIRCRRRSLPVDGSWRRCWQAETFRMIRRATELLVNAESMSHRSSTRRLVLVLVRITRRCAKQRTWKFVLGVSVSSPNQNAGAGGRHMSRLWWVLLFCLWWLSPAAPVLRGQVAQTISAEAKQVQKATHHGGRDDIEAIGNRKIGGRGLGNWYSLESEIRYGPRVLTGN